MSIRQQRAPTSSLRDDPYSGFNDYDHAYDLEDVYADRGFLQAIARSSHGRRPPTTGAPHPPPVPSAMDGVPFGGGAALSYPTQMGSKRIPAGAFGGIGTGFPRAALISRSRAGLRPGTAAAEPARPMTAVGAAGYTSAGRKSTFDAVIVAGGGEPNTEEGAESEAAAEKVRRQEEQVLGLLRESVFARQDEGNAKKALDKAKEAARKWRVADALRKAHSAGDANMDLSLTVLLCLAQQKQANNIPSEALQIYHTIIRDKSYVNAGRLKVNIGNLHFRKRDFNKAIKYYRMALDQVPKAQQRMRTKIINNIGVTLVKLGKYEDALVAFEDCLDAGGDCAMGLNLTLAAYCLNNEDKMREAFQRLVDIAPPGRGEELGEQQKGQDVLAVQLLSTDALTAWERHKKLQTERTILVAAKVIAQSIAPSFSEGYSWCVECIRQSVYASLATELEMNKVVEQLRQGRLDEAVEDLLAFNSKESKVASAASNNLALINILHGKDKLEEASQYCEQALSLDRYNANALVSRGNIHSCAGQPKMALQLYREALQVDASCTAAVFNLGLVCRAMGELEEAKRHFFKLNDMVMNSGQVLVQLAQIYEEQGQTEQATELYTQASSVCPTDPTILTKLAHLYETEGDKAQAFQYYYESFRHFPPNIEVIRWLGNYYLYAQFAEKAANYFEKAALMEPNSVEWHLLMASCQRRAGDFQRAMELYKLVHRRFPHNLECLKFLVQMCKELRMPAEEREYAEKVARLERTGQLKAQRKSDSAEMNRKRRNGAESTPGEVGGGSGAGVQRSATDDVPTRRDSPNTAARAHRLLEGTQQFQATRRDITAADLVWKGPMSGTEQSPSPGAAGRPMTGLRRGGVLEDGTELFEGNEGEELLPD